MASSRSCATLSSRQALPAASGTPRVSAHLSSPDAAASFAGCWSVGAAVIAWLSALLIATKVLVSASCSANNLPASASAGFGARQATSSEAAKSGPLRTKLRCSSETLPVAIYFACNAGSPISWKALQWLQVYEANSTIFTFAAGLPISTPPCGVALTALAQSVRAAAGTASNASARAMSTGRCPIIRQRLRAKTQNLV